MIIGVSGKKRSGKDTFYEILKDKLEIKKYKYVTVKKYAFADEVKKYAIDFFNVPENEIKLERNRFILQGIGELFRSKVNQNYWVNNLFESIYKSREKNPNEMSVITDVRHLNEVELILDQPYSLLVRIKNINTDKDDDKHRSEMELNDYPFDSYIENNGSLDDYRRSIEKWIDTNLPWIIL